jgi:transposase-like protein
MKRSQIASEIKVRAVLELLKGQKSAVEIAGPIGCHPTLLKEWKDRFLTGAPKIFETKKVEDEKTKKLEELERMVGKLAVQNEFLKKVSDSLGLA